MSSIIEVSKDEVDSAAKILVVGVGGGGNNAVDRMVTSGITGVKFICINTDQQQLRYCKAEHCIQIGEKLTKGLGAGSDPSQGEKAAEENKEELADAVRNYDMVIVTCGMGGGTGTGATPIVAQQAKEMGILTVGIVTTPFEFEGGARMERALEGVERLRHNVDTLIVISNEKVAEYVEDMGEEIDMDDAYAYPDEVLRQSIQGITDIINKKGTINLDFADVQKVMRDKGIAHVGMATAQGKNRCVTAVQKAIESPLLETSIEGASAVILNISGDIPFKETKEAMQYVRQLVDRKCNIIFGTISDKSVPETVTVTIIATGMEENQHREQEPIEINGMRSFGNPGPSKEDTYSSRNGSSMNGMSRNHTSSRNNDGYNNGSYNRNPYNNGGYNNPYQPMEEEDNGVGSKFKYKLTEGKGSDFKKYLSEQYASEPNNYNVTQKTIRNNRENEGIINPIKHWEKK